MIPEGEIRLRLTLQYDGTRYYGWQLQPRHATVQGELERVVERLTGGRRAVTGSGRTDRGVHALGQVASVDLPSHWTPDRFRSACNALLPDDIWISAVERAPGDFHPRYGAASRAYLYRVGTGDAAHSPFSTPYCWTVPGPLQMKPLARATGVLVGDHSFRGFAKSGQPERGDRCVVESAGWSAESGLLLFRIRANRFLHHMVRYLVGTLVEVGRGRRPWSDVPGLLEGHEGLVTSPPAPAKGLFLDQVRYPGDLPAGSPPAIGLSFLSHQELDEPE